MTRQQWQELTDQDECYLVNAIKRHLLTPEQREFIHAKDSSIEDMLNGRVENDDWSDVIFADWNAKLGWKEFYF